MARRALNSEEGGVILAVATENHGAAKWNTILQPLAMLLVLGTFGGFRTCVTEMEEVMNCWLAAKN